VFACVSVCVCARAKPYNLRRRARHSPHRSSIPDMFFHTKNEKKTRSSTARATGNYISQFQYCPHELKQLRAGDAKIISQIKYCFCERGYLRAAKPPHI